MQITRQERVRLFLLTFYSAPATCDWNALLQKYLREQLTGEYAVRLRALYISAA